MLYRREFDLLSYTGGCFQYQYQSNGKDVMVNFVVNEVDGDVCISVDGQSIGLTYEDFDKCEDIDDCSLISPVIILRIMMEMYLLNSLTIGAIHLQVSNILNE
jgi:hypothetical protein